MKKQHCCSRFIQPLGDQFQAKNFRLDHSSPDEFYKSQWQSNQRSLWWLLYRLCLAGYFVVAVVITVENFFMGGKYFIYLTDWGLVLCMLTTVYGAVLATLWYFDYSKREDSFEQGWGTKIFWALYWSSLVIALVVTLVYWSFLFPDNPEIGGSPYNLMQHAFNSAFMLIDYMLVAFPARLLHVIYPAGVALIYLIFSLIYFYAGGTDPFGHRWIYPILDWDKEPGIAAATTLGCLVLIILLSFLIFELHLLRKFIHRKTQTENTQVIRL